MKLSVGVKGIWRDVRCLITPEVATVTPDGGIERVNLILGLPWLFSVDALIGIRGSNISIGDESAGEVRKEVVGTKLVFCKEHNLIMYPRSASNVPGGLTGGLQGEVDSSDSDDSSFASSDDNDSDSSEDLDDVLDSKQVQLF